MGRILLVDGTAIAYRSFHAIRGLSTGAGRPTGAVYGMVNSVRRWTKQHEPSHVAVVFDRGMPAYRVEQLPDYKAQREEMPADLAAQLPVIEKVLAADGVAVVIQEGIEADDVLARLAADAIDRGDEAILVTSDKDMLPLIAIGVRMVQPHRENETCDADWVLGKYGVDPERIPDLLALTGDSSDNIPGVVGVGPKTAARLLAEFGGAAEVAAAVDRIRNPRVRDAVRAAGDDVVRNLGLVRLRPELVEQVPEPRLRLRRRDRDALVRLFTELEFRGMLEEALGDAQGDLPLNA